MLKKESIYPITFFLIILALSFASSYFFGFEEDTLPERTYKILIEDCTCIVYKEGLVILNGTNMLYDCDYSSNYPNTTNYNQYCCEVEECTAKFKNEKFI